MGLTASFVQDVVGEPVDDVLDASMLEHHLLVVAVALGGGSGADRAADEHIDLDVLSFLGGQAEELRVVPEEANVLPLFRLGPGKARLFGPGFPALYHGEDAVFLAGGCCFQGALVRGLG